MKNAKTIAALLLALSFLAACGAGPSAPAPRETEAAAPVGEAPADSEAAPSETDEAPPSVPEAADGLFFSCRNMHYVFLQELEGALIEFCILSEEPLSPEESLIDTGLEAQSRTEIRELRLAGYADPENVNAAADAVTVPNEVRMTVINIGELVKNLTDETRFAYPHIPWKAIAGFSDVAAHKYQTLRMEDVYETVVTDFPSLKEQIEEIL